MLVRPSHAFGRSACDAMQLSWECNASQLAVAPVGACPDVAILHVKFIVVLRAQHARSREAAANLNALHGSRVPQYSSPFRILPARPCTSAHHMMMEMPKLEKVQGACRLALEAGRDIRAFASSASSLSKTGEPRPFGQARITHVTSPPQESPVVRTLSITASQTHTF